MTDSSRYALLAARLLRARPPVKESDLSRDVGISVVAEAIARAQRRRRIRWAGFTAGLAAAASLALMLGLRHGTPPVSAANGCPGAHCGGPVAARQPDPGRHGLDRGQSIVAPTDAPASVVLPSGTQIALTAKSVLECREDGQTQRFALLGGSAHLHVAKLQAGERFLVQTPDAEVEVRGTVFDVRLEAATAACLARTVVTVTEGTVVARAAGVTTTLYTGNSWSSPCVSAQAKPPQSKSRRPSAVSAPALAIATSAAEAPAPVPPSPGATIERPVSDLSEQNDLYSAAETARRAGRNEEALATFGRLLARFPGGHFAEAAVLQRARIFARVDGARARAEAALYLARYPSGFAHVEMESLAHSP